MATSQLSTISIGLREVPYNRVNPLEQGTPGPCPCRFRRAVPHRGCSGRCQVYLQTIAACKEARGRIFITRNRTWLDCVFQNSGKRSSLLRVARLNQPPRLENKKGGIMKINKLLAVAFGTALLGFSLTAQTPAAPVQN